MTPTLAFEESIFFKSSDNLFFRATVCRPLFFYFYCFFNPPAVAYVEYRIERHANGKKRASQLFRPVGRYDYKLGAVFFQFLYRNDTLAEELGSLFFVVRYRGEFERHFFKREVGYFGNLINAAEGDFFYFR